MTWFAKRGLPHTSILLTLTIHKFWLVKAFDLKFSQQEEVPTQLRNSFICLLTTKVWSSKFIKLDVTPFHKSSHILWTLGYTQHIIFYSSMVFKLLATYITVVKYLKTTFCDFADSLEHLVIGELFSPSKQQDLAFYTPKSNI